jgi:hypothetical protein
VDCARVDEELIAFHLAALDGATRAGVEAHLTGCARCVSSFLALKRAVDAGEDAPAPSEMARARVRAEAERQLALVGAQLMAQKEPAAATTATAAKKPEPARRRTTWALVATAAAAMVAAPFVYVQMQKTAGPSPTTVSAPTVPPPAVVPVSTDGKSETVDTARATPENLAFL